MNLNSETILITFGDSWVTGEGAPDFKPNQNTYNSKEDVGYVWDTARVFNNLYSEVNDE